MSPYAASKKAGEVICYAHHHLYGNPVTCLRFFTVYGPGQRPGMAIHLFSRRLLDGKPLPVFGDGSTKRDYTFVDDIVDGVFAALQRADGYRIYNLGGAHTTELSRLIATLEDVFDKKAEIETRPEQAGGCPRHLGGHHAGRTGARFPPEGRSPRGPETIRGVVPEGEGGWQGRMRRYLVTGGAGFIGSHVVAGVLARGDHATVLDNLSTGSRDNLQEVIGEVGGADRLQLVEGSVTDDRSVAAAMDGVDGVVHLAALPSVVRSVEEPRESHDNNVTGTVVVLDAARRRGVKVVYAGSSSAYGDQDQDYKSEDLREQPLSPYAATKLAGELYCRSFAQVYDLPVVVTRFFNVFGPRQVPDSPYSGVVAAFCFALLRDKRPRIDGDGSQSRDFTYVGDVARGILLALDTDTEGCHTVNLACGGNHSIRNLLDALIEVSGVSVEPEFAPPRTGDVMHSRADISRIRALLGFEPQVSFVDGLRHTYDWYRRTYS